jgi:hypothetical protein
MGERGTDAVEALLIRYEHELNSLQPEDFTARIQSWKWELEVTASAVVLAIIQPRCRAIEECLQALSTQGWSVNSVECNTLWDALNEARKALRSYAEHGTAVREQPAEYRVTGPIRTYDSLPYERREEFHPPHVRFTEGTPDRSYPVWFATDRQIIPAGRRIFARPVSGPRH